MSRSSFIESLARAYAERGRYEDAQRLLSEAMQADQATPPVDSDNWYESPGHTVCGYASVSCEVALELGFAQTALTVAETHVEGNEGTCAQEFFGVAACAAAAMTALGNEQEGAALLDQHAPNTEEMQEGYATARSRLLLTAGHQDAAYATARADCLGGMESPACRNVAIALARSIGSAATDVDDASAKLAALRQQEGGTFGPGWRRELDVAIEASDCEVRLRLASRAPETRTTCARAVERATLVHGDRHVRVAEARALYARALTAARQRREAAAQRELVEATVQALGPNHPLRSRRR